MRRRSLSPAFFHDEYLVTQPFSTRILFEGLWCLADREGRLEDRPIRIKMQVFPADDVDVDAALTALAEGGMVTRYEVDGIKYLQVNTFGKHQHPHPNETPSQIPPARTTKVIRADNQGETRTGGYSGSSDTQDLRSVGVPAVAPAGRPADAPPANPVRDEWLQPPPRTKPLAYKPRLDVAWPGRPPVPSGLHAEFITKLGGDPEEARRKLLAWYPVCADDWADKPIGDDDFAFWRHRFREWVGTTRTADRARAAPAPASYDDWCDHEPRCASREWHAMLNARAAGVREATA